MALRGKLKTYKTKEGTKSVRIWKDLEMAGSPTGAASRLMLIDTKGEIPSDILCDWLSGVESERRDWEKNKEKETTSNG